MVAVVISMVAYLRTFSRLHTSRRRIPLDTVSKTHKLEAAAGTLIESVR